MSILFDVKRITLFFCLNTYAKDLIQVQVHTPLEPVKKNPPFVIWQKIQE